MVVVVVIIEVTDGGGCVDNKSDSLVSHHLEGNRGRSLYSFVLSVQL